MKGIVFSEFSDMVEKKFSIELLDEIIVESDLPSGGAYTTVGTYDHQEIIQLVGKLSDKTGVAVDDLLYTFGLHLAQQFALKFNTFFVEAGNLYDFMKSLDNHIHVEVLKLYPDAELPKFLFDDSDPTCLVMEYLSDRGFGMLAHGLVSGVADYYRESVRIEVEHLNKNQHVLFRLYKQ